MLTKKEQVAKLFAKLGLPMSNAMFNPGNDTISKEGLLKISLAITELINKDSATLPTQNPSKPPSQQGYHDFMLNIVGTELL